MKFDINTIIVESKEAAIKTLWNGVASFGDVLKNMQDTPDLQGLESVIKALEGLKEEITKEAEETDKIRYDYGFGSIVRSPRT